MASFEFGEALKLQNPLLQSEVLNSIITADEVMKSGYMPFIDTNGLIVIAYNRINSYGSTRAGAVAGTGAVTHSAATFTNVTGRVMTYASQVRVPRVYSADPIFAADQVAAKAYDCGLAFSTDLGASAGAADTTLNAPGYGGLVSGATQTISAHDTAITGVLSFTKLDELSDAVKEQGPKGYIMPAGTIRSYRALNRTAGVSPQELAMGDWGMPVLMHNGVPIFKNEFIATNIVQGGAAGVNTSKIYCAMFDPVRGLHGFFNGAGVLQVIGPYEVPATVSQEYSIEFNVGVALKSTFALAQLVGVSN